MCLQGMQLVAEERGRQRDTLGLRVSELEAQNAYYQQRLETIEQNKALSARRQKYSCKHRQHTCMHQGGGGTRCI